MSGNHPVWGGIEWTPANVVTMIRIGFIPLFIAVLLVPWGTSYFDDNSSGLLVQAIVSVVVFGLICLTDSIDGYLARSRNEVTVFGKFMDPIADKVLVVAALLCLVQLGLSGCIVPIIIVAREMLVSGLRMLVASAGVVVAASILGKIKTATTMVAICLTIMLLAPAFSSLAWYVAVARVSMLIAVIFTVWSMVDYFAKAWPLLTANSSKPSQHDVAKDARKSDFKWGTMEGEHANAKPVVDSLLKSGLTISTAESCTGGLIAGALTSVAGSSSAVVGGAVTYMVKEKVRALEVPQTTVDDHGVVSAQTAEAMALGAKIKLGSDYAVSTTGIAGPGGGTDELPVGTVWFGLALPDGTCVSKMKVFEGTRSQVRAQAVDEALSLVLDSLC